MDAPRQAVSDSSLLLTLGLNHLLAMATLIDEIIKFLSAIGSLVKDVKELARYYISSLPWFCHVLKYLVYRNLLYCPTTRNLNMYVYDFDGANDHYSEF